MKNILLLLVTSVLIATALGQTKQQRNITLNGQSGTADVIDQNGRLFVDVSALANIGKGSLTFSANSLVLTFPATTNLAAAATESPAAPSRPANTSALSPEFMKAAIEEIASLREWATTLASAIRGGYGVTDEWVGGYRDQASQNMQLAEVAASTAGDHQAAQLLRHASDLVQQWSDNLVAAKKSMDTAKYTTSPNALRDDPLSQKIITCGRFLARMLGSATFQDDASCH